MARNLRGLDEEGLFLARLFMLSSNGGEAQRATLGAGGLTAPSTTSVRGNQGGHDDER